jgi:hypothetical protein
MDLWVSQGISVELHTLSNAIRVTSLDLNVDRKWAVIFLFYIAPAGF